MLYKGIVHEVKGYAPFTGAMVVANGWGHPTSNEVIDETLKLTSIKTRPSVIMRQIMSNPNNQGIIFAGLDWSIQLRDMLELIELANKNNLLVLINVPCSLDEFMERLGKVTLEITSSRYLVKDLADAEKSDLLRQIGTAQLSYITENIDLTIVTDFDSPKAYSFVKGDRDETRH